MCVLLVDIRLCADTFSRGRYIYSRVLTLVGGAETRRGRIRPPSPRFSAGLITEADTPSEAFMLTHRVHAATVDTLCYYNSHYYKISNSFSTKCTVLTGI